MVTLQRRCEKDAGGKVIVKNIFLIGFMGCGKSTVAAHLFEEYGFQIIEMDQVLVERVGMSISEMFEKYGETYFRNEETKLLTECENQTDKVVSCGGGVVLRKENVEIMKRSGKVVWLTANPETILSRVKNDENRPLLEGNKNVLSIAHMLEKRYANYEAAADVIIETDDKSIEDICKEILRKTND